MKKSLLLALMPLIVTTSCSNPTSSLSSEIDFCVQVPPSPPLSTRSHFILKTGEVEVFSQSDIRIETFLAFYNKEKVDSQCPDYAMVYINKNNSGEYSADESKVLFESSNKEELEKFYFITDDGNNPIRYDGKVELKLPIDYFTEDCHILKIYYSFKNPKESNGEQISSDGGLTIFYRKLANKKIAIM